MINKIKNKIYNPFTGRKVSAKGYLGGLISKMLKSTKDLSEYNESGNKILNPLTGRMVSDKGYVGQLITKTSKSFQDLLNNIFSIENDEKYTPKKLKTKSKQEE